MSHITGKCEVCDTNVIFDEDPYRNPNATKYWKSTYTKTDNYMFIVQRQTPSWGKRGQIKIQTLFEYVLALYCSPNCGLKHYQENKDEQKRN